jgi:hypothetical protein
MMSSVSPAGVCARVLARAHHRLPLALQLRPRIHARYFELSDLPAALLELQERRVSGKAVIHVTPAAAAAAGSHHARPRL